MLKVFKGCTQFYGNSTVYITDGDRVQRFEKHNYQIENLKDDGDDIWITSGIIVALGACCPLEDAIQQLKKVIRCLRAESHERSVSK